MAPLLLILPFILLLAAGSAAARDGGEGLYPAACYLLWPTTGAVSQGHDHVKQGVGDGCSLDSCWKEIEREGIKECAYGRGSELTLAIKGSAKAAKQFVAGEIASAGMKKLRKYKGYDLAGVRSNAKEAIVEMPVGKNIARLSLGAASDTDPSPTWPGVRKETIEDAVLVGFQLRTPGCPEDLAKCH